MSRNHPANHEVFNLGQLLKKERAHILDRRAKSGKSSDLDNDSLGIALSGGGIRSATICLGVMRELNKKGLLKKADYLSSVSGGGYLASYIHSSLQEKLESTDNINVSNTEDVYDELFSESDINHIREYREYLYIWKGKGIQRIFSNIWLFGIALFGTVTNSLWWIMPFIYRWVVYRYDVLPDIDWWIHSLTMVGIALILGISLSPNFTSPHRFYKRRLQKAYLLYRKQIKLWELDRPRAPYPLVNANISVNYDKYDQHDNISYRGPIKSNYFLFSPLYCGSQVTGYTNSNSNTYRSTSLATAMATSAAAVNTFMGNFKLPFIVRQLMALLNLRTGILAPNPRLKHGKLAFWPHYTFLEVMGNSATTTHYIQVSDGGHIENLGIYELLRRKVKVIIAIDAGEDEGFEFSDLRNLVMRARSELGVIIDFHPNAKPQDVIKQDETNGFSDRYFVVAKISGMKGSYTPDYDGILIYIKSTLLASLTFDLRNIKNMVKRLVREGKADQAENAKRQLDSYIYRTYNPSFPHEPTSDQFFDEAQWNAYQDLGVEIGRHVCSLLEVESGDTGAAIFEKGAAFFQKYSFAKNENKGPD